MFTWYALRVLYLRTLLYLRGTHLIKSLKNIAEELHNFILALS